MGNAMAHLTSFGSNLTVLVVGASGGIGQALLRALEDDPAVARCIVWSRRPVAPSSPKLTAMRVDITEERDIEAALEQLGDVDAVHLVLIASGVLHDDTGLMPEKNIAAVTAQSLEQVFRINTVGPALVAKHLVAKLPRSGKSVIAALSARVGSIGDNRLGGWYAYRASKAALNMIIKNLAIEVARRRKEAVCVGLHPGTVDTDLSKPFQSGVPTEKLFTPELSADHLLRVVDGLTASDSGRVFAWDGTPIDP